MRMMMTVTIPVESGNAAVKAGTLASTIKKTLQEMKPEAAYFMADEQGQRTGMIVFDMTESSQLPALAEPWFLGFNASVTVRPVMNAQDLEAALPGLERAAKAH